eukprot:gene354-265_t
MAQFTEERVWGEVLKCSYDPKHANYVGDAVVELLKKRAGGEELKIDFSHADQLIEHMCGKFCVKQTAQLRYLAECFGRCEDFGKRSDKLSDQTKQRLPEIMRMLCRYANLTLTCCEMFVDAEGNCNMDPVAGSQVLMQFLAGPPPGAAAGGASSSTAGPNAKTDELPRLSINFVSLLATTIVEEDPQDGESSLRELFMPVLDVLMGRIKGRHFADMKIQDTNYLCGILCQKGPLTKMMVRHSTQFLPPPPTMFGVKPENVRQGFQLQMESFFGSLLCPTVLDAALYGDRCVAKQNFANVKYQRAATAALSHLRGQVAQQQEQTRNVVNPILRCGDDCRERVLQWIALVLRGAEGRAKGANQIHEGGDVQGFLDTMRDGLPMEQDLDMRLRLQLQRAKTQGFGTPGFALNLFCLIMDLVAPIKVGNAPTLDASLLACDDLAAWLLYNFATEEAKMADSEKVEAAKKITIEALGKKDASREEQSKLFKFPTQMWFLALKALHVVLLPTLKEAFCYTCAVGTFQGRDMDKFERCFAEHLCHAVVLESEAFVGQTAHFVFYLFGAFIEHCGMTPGKPGKALDAGARAADSFRNVSIPPSSVSPQWALLPAAVVNDLVELLTHFQNMMPPKSTKLHDIFHRLDAELLTLIMVFILGSGEHVKNPSIRAKVAKLMHTWSRHQRFQDLMSNYPAVANNLMPAMIRVFTAVEKEKMSYYDIRFQLKYELRIPIMEMMEMLIPQKLHKEVLRKYAKTPEDEDTFLKFLNQMMNDATMQLDEGLDTLAAIRRRARGGAASSSSANPNGAAAGSNENGENNDEDALMGTGAAGVGVDRGGYRRSRTDPKDHCKQYMKLGFRTIKTLWFVCKETPEILARKQHVLQQFLHSCLNACLDRLVGPKCMQLKGDARDFEEFKFKPKELLSMIAEMYLAVAKLEKDRVMKTIIEDGRAYHPGTFEKSYRILKRERILPEKVVEEWHEFIKELGATGTSQEEALADVDIPDEFLDPLMAEIMADPVKLPSGNIMDRAVIERHIMSSDNDPFTRDPLSISELVPDTELKEKIHAFCKEKGIKI